MRTIYITVIISFLIFLSGCNDWIDKSQPTTSVETEKAITSAKDAKYVLNGIYSNIRGYEYYGARYIYYGDVKGEDMQSYKTSSRTANYYLFTYNDSNAPSSFWTIPYAIIRNTNNVLRYIQTLSPEHMTDEFKDIYGQALTIRAMAHFDLVKVYGETYTKNNGNALGVPIIDKVCDNSYKPSRNTVYEVYNDLIIPDLKEASSNIGIARNNGRLNRFGTLLLLARAYLYIGDDINALKYATELITLANDNGYKLWTRDEYISSWSKEFTSEVLYEISIKASESGPGKEGIGYLTWKSGYNDMFLSTDYLNLIQSDPNDIRNKIMEKSGSRYYLTKYVGEGDENPTYANIRVLRLTEAYLIAAEAAVKLNDNNNALKYLNPIVERGNPTATISGTVSLDRVLLERRKELVGEGHRFFDAMRNNQTISRLGTSHLSALTSKTKVFDWNYEKVKMYIPQSEINANSNIVQN